MPEPSGGQAPDRQSAGDTLFVRGGTTHRWRQIGRAKCRMLSVLHAPQARAAREGRLDAITRQPESPAPAALACLKAAAVVLVPLTSRRP